MRVLLIEDHERLLAAVREVLHNEQLADVLALILSGTPSDKPLAPEEPAARPRRRAGDAQPVNERPLRARDLEIDNANRMVRRGGRAIYLSPCLFALLQLLVRHRGRLVTRQMIWRHLYDEKDEFSHNRINVLVWLLRKKIDRGFDRPLIQTRQRLGYVLRGADGE